MQLIDLYYQAYKEWSSGQEMPKKQWYKRFQTFAAIAELKGRTFAVFWYILFLSSLVLLGLLIMLTVIGMSGLSGCPPQFRWVGWICGALWVITFIYMIASDKMDLKRNYQHKYQQKLLKALNLKHKFRHTFRFSSVQQFEMVYRDALQKKEQINAKLTHYRSLGNKLVWEIIVASSLAFFSVLTTGIMDNYTQTPHMQTFILLLVKMFVYLVVSVLLIRTIIECVIYLYEKELWRFTDFLEYIQIIIDYQKRNHSVVLKISNLKKIRGDAGSRAKCAPRLSGAARAAYPDSGTGDQTND